MELSKIEKETIILWNQEEDVVNISTFDEKWIKRIKGLAKKYPDIFVIEDIDRHGCLSAVLPKAYFRMSFAEPLSEEERKVRSERAKRIGLGRAK